MKVIFIYASPQDLDHVKKMMTVLDEFGISYNEHMASAHKVPERVFELVQEYNKDDDALCYITVAGRSNGLSGVVAANSIHPVIACPPFADKVDYKVNIDSSLQMPSDTPVMTVIDPKNAALAAVRIVGLKDAGIQKKLSAYLKKVKGQYT